MRFLAWVDGETLDRPPMPGTENGPEKIQGSRMSIAPLHDPIVVQVKDREEWKNIRYSTIGASEVAALFESVANESPIEGEDDDFDYEQAGEPVSPYLSPLSLWALKTGRYRATEKTNNRIAWGTELEPLIARKLAETHGWVLKKPRGYYIHPRLSHMGASLDFEIDIEGVGTDIPLEIKNVAADQRWKWKNSTGDWLVPAHIMMQVQHQLSVTGRNEAYIGVLFGGSEDRYFVIQRDEDLISEIEQTIEEFWWFVENKVQPEPNFQRDARVINRLYVHSMPSDVADWTGNEEAKELVAQMKRLSADSNQAKKAADEIRARLVVMLGNYQAADLGDALLKATIIGEAEISYTREAYLKLSTSKKPQKHGGSPLNSGGGRKKKAAAEV